MSTSTGSGSADYLKAVFGFDAVVQRADPSRWGEPAPCEGWAARDVVNHMVFMVDMVAGMAQGDPAVIPGSEGFPAPGVPDRVFRNELLQLVIQPLIGPDDDPQEVWAEHRDKLLDALADPAALGAESMSPWGHTTTEAFLGMAGGDAVVHTWDLAKALGQEPVIDAQLAESALRAWSGSEASGSPVRQPNILGEPVTTTADDPVSRLIAYSGRNPD